jgi:hypothetical protein
MAVAEAVVPQKVGHNQHVTRFRHLCAGRLFPRDLPVVDANPRLEPLTVAIGQGNRRNRQPEELAGHPGDAIEALAG